MTGIGGRHGVKHTKKKSVLILLNGIIEIDVLLVQNFLNIADADQNWFDKALNQSSATEGTRRKEIAPATYAILFLGTPHRGSRAASIGKIAYQITQIGTRRPNTKLLRALERNSETLDRVGDGFIQSMLKHNIKIYSFREEVEIRRLFIFHSLVSETHFYPLLENDVRQAPRAF